jgi:iron-sulfur cluster repair protein YtfE (RIC family)
MLKKTQITTVETISTHLAHEHARCDALFNQVKLSLEDGQWPAADRAFACFREALERHLLIEERIVFPAYEKAVHQLATATAAMRTEHLRLRAIAQRLADAIRKRQPSEVNSHIDILTDVAEQHHYTEENMIYPMVERVLGPRQAGIIVEMHAFGAADIVAKAA